MGGVPSPPGSCAPSCWGRSETQAADLARRIRATYRPHLLRVIDEPNAANLFRVEAALARLEADGLLRRYRYLVAARMDRFFNQPVDVARLCSEDVPRGREFFLVSGKPNFSKVMGGATRTIGTPHHAHLPNPCPL